MKRIFITGGHFDPAYAVIRELHRQDGWEIFYLGRRQAMEDDQAEALEYQEINKLRNVHYLVITTGRIQPKFFVNINQSIKAFLKIFIGLAQALFWIIKFRPNIVLSFGGFVAVPVVFWAWFLGIPVATHEQTTVSGEANKFLALLADKALISWPESARHFPKEKVVLTGNPIREEILTARPEKHEKPLIYVTGGNQGAHVLNLAIEKILSKLMAKYEVVHQTGDARQFGDFDRLAKTASKNYHVAKFLTAPEVAKVLASADLVITRAGANITKEILALGKMAIFIPIPWSKANEQMQNALMVQNIGVGEILPQEKLTSQSLLALITKMFAHKKDYLENVGKAKALVIPDATQKIVAEINTLVFP